VTRPTLDTLRFEAPAAASRCGRAGHVLLRGSEGGNGVLVWLRSADSLAGGEFPLLARGDSVASRGAVVAVRFMLGEAAHGFTFDSGAVFLTRTAGLLSATARGSGSDSDPAGVAGRVALDASFQSVPLGSDTVACQIRL